MDGLERCWLLLIPGNLSVENPVPLVPPNRSCTSEGQPNLSSFADLASEGHRGVPARRGQLLGFGLQRRRQRFRRHFAAVIDAVAAVHPIDTARVHMTGWSNGCMMTQRFMAEGPEVLASAGCMAGYLMTDALDVHRTDSSWRCTVCSTPRCCTPTIPGRPPSSKTMQA